MGMVNWLARFIPNASSVAAPINDLLKDNITWILGTSQLTGFRNITKLLTSAPALAFYDPSRPTMVSSDASSYGIDGCILQQHGEQ